MAIASQLRKLLGFHRANSGPISDSEWLASFAVILKDFYQRKIDATTFRRRFMTLGALPVTCACGGTYAVSQGIRGTDDADCLTYRLTCPHCHKVQAVKHYSTTTSKGA